jgi:ABC-type multidrug transport system fused ATPase/permease subunit
VLPATRKKRTRRPRLTIICALILAVAIPPGWKPGSTAGKDACRYREKSRAVRGGWLTLSTRMTDFLRKLLKLIAPYRARFIGGILSGVLFAVANAALMLLLKLVVDIIFPQEGAKSASDYIQKLPTFVQHFSSGLIDWLAQFKSSASQSQIVFFILLIPAMMFIRVAAAYFNFYLLNWVAIRAIMDLRTQLFSHLQNLSLSFLHRTTTGELISRISSDTYALSKTLSSSLPVLIREPLTLVVLGGTLIWQQPKLTLLSVIVVPLCVLPIVIYGRKTRKSSEVIQTNMAELTNIMEEAFSGNRIVKAFNLEEPMLKRFQEKTRVYINHFMRVVRSMELPSTFIEFMAGVGIALIMLYLGVFAKGKTTMGDMMQFIGSIMLMYAPIKALARLHGQLEQGRASSQRIFEMLDEQSSIVEPANPTPLNATGKEIAFSSIDFSYGDKAILHEVNLTVKPGQLVALVGSTGSGKICCCAFTIHKRGKSPSAEQTSARLQLTCCGSRWLWSLKTRSCSTTRSATTSRLVVLAPPRRKSSLPPRPRTLMNSSWRKAAATTQSSAREVHCSPADKSSGLPSHARY